MQSSSNRSDSLSSENASLRSSLQALGLDESASAADVRRVYRKLVKQYHPDINPSQDAAGRFRRIQHAYLTLKGLSYGIDRRPADAARGLEALRPAYVPQKAIGPRLDLAPIIALVTALITVLVACMVFPEIQDRLRLEAASESNVPLTGEVWDSIRRTAICQAVGLGILAALPVLGIGTLWHLIGRPRRSKSRGKGHARP